MRLQSFIGPLIAAFFLTGCNSASTDTPNSKATVNTVEAFKAECRRLINQGVIDPKFAVFKFEDVAGQLQVTVTTTNPDDGLQATLDYVCEQDGDGTVTSSFLAD